MAGFGGRIKSIYHDHFTPRRLTPCGEIACRCNFTITLSGCQPPFLLIKKGEKTIPNRLTLAIPRYIIVTVEPRAPKSAGRGKNKMAYCVKRTECCDTCSLVNDGRYGRDCHNNPLARCEDCGELIANNEFSDLSSGHVWIRYCSDCAGKSSPSGTHGKGKNNETLL